MTLAPMEAIRNSGNVIKNRLLPSAIQQAVRIGAGELSRMTQQIREKAFEKLEYTTRYILLTLATMPLPVRVEDWRTAFDNFRQKHMAKLGLQCDEQKWNEAVRVLEDCFVVTDRLDDGFIVKFYNPSVRDFLSAYIGKYSETCGLLIEGAYYTEQLYSMFSDWKWYNHHLYTGASYVIIEQEKLDAVKNVFLRLRETQKTCLLEYSNRLKNKVCPYDEFGYLQHMLKYFPQMCRNNPGLIEQFVTEDMLKDDEYQISERLKLLNDIKLEYNKKIEPKTILNEMTNELEYAEDYVDFIETAADFDIVDEFENDEFKNRFKENVSREIDNAGSESEIDSLEDNINKISLKFPDWEIDFVEDLECQRMKLSERAYEREEWERDKVEDTSVDEDTMIHEMFTSLRVKTEG